MSESKKQYKCFGTASVKVLDADPLGEGVVEAIVSTFNVVDMGGDMIVPGAFTDSLNKSLPKIVWMHDWTMPVGTTIEARELSPNDPLLPAQIKQYGGLYVKGQFNLDTQRGREAFSDVKKGVIDEFSIGFFTLADEVDKKTSVRKIKKIDLFEWSPVLLGMNPLTAPISAKGAHMPDIKGKYFGDYVPSALAFDALSTLAGVLLWDIFYDAVFGCYCYDEDAECYMYSQMSPDDGAEMIEGACDEFKGYAKSSYRALMSLASDSSEGSSDKSAKYAIEAATKLRQALIDPNDLKAGLPLAGLTAEKHSQSVLATVSGFAERVESIKDARSTDGKSPVSEQMATRLLAQAKALGDAAKRLQELASECKSATAIDRDRLEAEAKHLQLKHKHRSALAAA